MLWSHTVLVHITALWARWHSSFYILLQHSWSVNLSNYKHKNTQHITANLCISSAYAFLALSVSQPPRGPEALETAADSNWWYTLHQRAAATPWCALAGLLLPARQIWRAPAHLILTPKTVSVICSTPECSRYLLMFDGHGHTPLWRTITVAFHVVH